MSNTQDVTVDSSTPVSEDTQSQSLQVEATDGSTSPKGSQTPETRLYAALDDERKRRKDLEREVKELKASVSFGGSSEDVSYTDDSVEFLRNEVRSLKDSIELEKIKSQFPQLNGFLNEFNEFREDYQSLDIKSVAELFLLRKGALETGTQRQGLEKPSGGAKLPQSSKHSKEDIKRIREDQPRKYAEMLRSGKLNPDDIE